VVAWRFLLASDDEKDEPKQIRGHPVILDGAHFILGNAQDIGRRKEQQDAFGFSDTESDRVKAQGLLAVINEDPQDACEMLIAQIIGKGFEQQDNVTGVVLVCEQVDTTVSG
jgi:hypothetical protein